MSEKRIERRGRRERGSGGRGGRRKDTDEERREGGKEKQARGREGRQADRDEMKVGIERGMEKRNWREDGEDE